VVAPVSVLAFVAASDPSFGANALTSPISIVAWVVANARKREEIGGWFLYYLWSVYSGAALSFIFFIILFHNCVPEFWESPGLYHWYLAALIPVLIAFALQVAMATMLISVRTPDMFRLFRWLQVVHLVLAVATVIIRARYFPDTAAVNAVAAGTQAIWTFYLFFSRRVKAVFLTQNWENTSAAWYPTTTRLMS
jgi:hypothetical protein